MERFSDEVERFKAPYVDLHDEIFEEIEGRLFDSRNNDKCLFTYIRYLALPSGVFKYSPDNGDNFDKEELVKEIIKRCPVSLFKHICRCLKRNPTYGKSDISSKGGSVKRDVYYNGFYMLAYPTRKYHYAVINNGAFCLTEYYRYDKSHQCKADLLFIEDDKGKADKLARAYLLEIRKLRRKFKQKLTLQDIQKVMEEYETEIRNWRSKNEKEREEEQEPILRIEKLYFFNSEIKDYSI